MTAAAERALAAGFDEPVDEALESDFTPADPGEQFIAALIRGRTRREVAADKHVSLNTVHAHVTEAVRNRGGAAGTHRENMVVIHAGIDDVIARAYVALDSGEYVSDRAELLGVLLSALRFRAGLFAATKGGPRPKGADS